MYTPCMLPTALPTPPRLRIQKSFLASVILIYVQERLKNDDQDGFNAESILPVDLVPPLSLCLLIQWAPYLS